MQPIQFGKSTSYVIIGGREQDRIGKAMDMMDNHPGTAAQIERKGRTTYMQFYNRETDTPHTTVLAIGHEAERQGNVIDLRI